MNFTKKFLVGLVSSLLLSCGFVRAAEMTSALTDGTDLGRGALHASEAPNCALCAFTEAKDVTPNCALCAFTQE